MEEFILVYNSKGRVHNDKEGMAGGAWIRKFADHISIEHRKQREPTRSRVKL